MRWYNQKIQNRKPETRNPLFKIQNSSIDMPLLIITVILVMVGLIMVYSVTLNNNFIFLKGQVIRILVGFAVLIIAFNIPYQIYQNKWVKYFMLAGIVVLLITTLILGRQVAAVKRWAGFFQPSEIAKYILIIYLSSYFAEKKEAGIDVSSWKCLLTPSIITALLCGLIMKQPALGTTIILFSSALVIFFVSGVKLYQVLVIILIGSALIGIKINKTKYAQDRVKFFSLGKTYQQEQSRIAIGSGGIIGQGLGEGKQKFYFLPKLHTDFIFSGIGEEFGLIGSVLVLTLFYLLFNRGIKIGIEANDKFASLLVFGIMTVIFQYVLIHLGVALSLIPCTGQPLPFISYGGSALVSNLYAIGIVLNISKHRRQNNGIISDFNWRNRRTYIPGAFSR